jgi:hypothetical protein
MLNPQRLAVTVALLAPMLSVNAFALSPDAQEGEKHYASCNSCHNPELTPPLAPPMWGVQRRYTRQTTDKSDFINSIVTFSQSPTANKAIFKHAVEKLGLMPAISLPEQDLRNIATYIFEAQFPPPCTHWQYGVEASMKSGDLEHAEKDRRMLKKFCGK